MSTVAKLETNAVRAPDTFAQAFLKLQAAIRPAIKEAENEAFKRGGKASKYADLSAVWEAVKSPLHEHGFVIIQSPDFEGADMWLKTTVLHTSGDKIEGRYPLRPARNDPQGYGSALTYARRYSISAMLGVIADDDDDGNAASNVGSGAKPAASASAPAQMRAPQAAPTDGDDADVIEGVKNWVAKQKAIIDAATRLPDLFMWADENCLGGTPADPATGSILYRLKKKAPDAFHEIVRHYQQKSEALGKPQ